MKSKLNRTHKVYDTLKFGLCEQLQCKKCHLMRNSSKIHKTLFHTSSDSRSYTMPNARLIQRCKTGQTPIIARTAVLSIAADRRKHSAAKHTICLYISNLVIQV